MNLTATRVAFLLVVTFAVVGCSETPLDQYRDAMDAVAQAREDVTDEKAEVVELREELADLKEQLNEAVAELENERAELNHARQVAAERATDQVLFNVIQNKLLDDDRFEQAAIAVGVDNGVVTLTGMVPDAATREAAGKVAASQAGVTDVVMKLTVKGAKKS